ncbi:molybdopterin-synthase adenylyltransferase MoeB [Veronia nyctiphanis]|uniref:Molybdopterin-synthase adenylyltransferase MoeB n=1 Tax=Veronia nyctiphanis TaxID=1278244 RepID=A0A4Q0YPX7_9GAMM|nr:HesA/MoeB/ThiF family protein [Veronia nyctiphanis]RXJ72605.1 molybdopterin-synthase adenylyltransferase MoeB [Veronia nyctiphanis]
MAALSDSQFTRYSRQVMLPEIGETGQSALLEANVLIVGCGGLGTAASLYLAGAGIGHLVIADGDTLDTSNLHRQVAYREADLNANKAKMLSAQLKALNGDISVRVVSSMLSQDRLTMEVAMADVVLDCSDNMSTRQAVNRACLSEKTPLISGAAIGWQGQHMVFDFRQPSPCYRCLFHVEHDRPDNNCQSGGVVGPVVGTIGNFQALAALKLLSGNDCCPATFHQFCGKTMTMTKLDIQRDPACPSCSSFQAKEAS